MILPDFVPAEYHQALSDAMDLYEIDAPNRAFAFLANCAHETAGFTRLVENLNYSPQRLAAVFPRRFTAAETVDFAHDEQRIAERIYGSRMGNGAPGSGDGWKYRGFGILQLTFKDNYSAFSKDSGIDLVTDPEKYRTDLSVIIKTAIWFWNKNGLNKFADAKDILGATKKINGGTNGLEDRKKHYNELMA